MSGKLQGLDIDDGMMDKSRNHLFYEKEKANQADQCFKKRIAAGAGVPIAEVNRLCSEPEADDETDVWIVRW
nr:hypothetical protein [Anaerostipes sp. 494a]